MRLIAGAMSGTSADGVDVALVAVEGQGLGMSARLVRHGHRDYPDELRKTIHAFREQGRFSFADLARCGREISLEYARATRAVLTEAGHDPAQLAALAAHGQTLFHDPPNTIQWLDPALVAAEVGCRVISDFRRADCAAGGQGAPLVPFADYLLFRDPKVWRLLLNIGGIANFTVLPPGCLPEQLVAFDTGPGNCISDWVCRTRGPAGMGWDEGGAAACGGDVIEPVCAEFLAHSYFSRPAPKSTDGPMMIELFRHATGTHEYAFEDLLATAAYLTARTIAVAAQALAPKGSACELIASGGGVQNRAIMRHLESELPDVRMRTTTDFGIPADAKEAVAFALLGAATLDGIPANLPSCTGAKRAVVLGSITPGP